jgi:membrane protease YdiL (CAAX protease family)
MAGITEGRKGIVRLLRRCIMWRVGLAWYLVVLLFIPAVFLVSIVAVPGVIAAFQVPSLSVGLTYLALFAIAAFAALGQEEVGWRGFALPRLQMRHGPLLGTLLLGSLWGLWHLPVRVFVSGIGSLGVGFLGVGDFLGWFGSTVAFAILITWAFNHSRGSVFLALLFHASSGATFGIFPVAFFPALSSQPYMSIAPEIGMIIAAVLIVVATRGRLGYDRYRRETAQSTPIPGDQFFAPPRHLLSASKVHGGLGGQIGGIKMRCDSPPCL